MKVLVTGANGLLGSEVWKVFESSHELWALGRTPPPFVPANRWKECDLTAAAAVYSVVTRLNPDLVVHCASYNNVDAAETHSEEAFRVNALGPRNLALACQRFDAALLAVSTDYVFDGTGAPEQGYREFDACRPLSVYAQSKWWGEEQVRRLLSRWYIVRTSWLFGSRRPTYVDQVLAWARQKKPIPCLQDTVSSPTSAADLAEALRHLAESSRFGLYHLSNVGFCSRVELARETLRLGRLSDGAQLQVVTQDQLRLPARRPAFSGLDNFQWRLDGFAPLRPWKEALADHLRSQKGVCA